MRIRRLTTIRQLVEWLSAYEHGVAHRVRLMAQEGVPASQILAYLLDYRQEVIGKFEEWEMPEQDLIESELAK